MDKKTEKMLEGNRIFITGATGLIGKCLIKKILRYNKTIAEQPIRIIALVRDMQKAERIFGQDHKELQLIPGNVCTWEPQDLGVRYIIHGASETSSRAFVSRPVETIRTALEGTQNMLEMARLNPVEGFVYLSSMEVYGTPETDAKIKEGHGTDLDPMRVRSAYPISKRMCENLCCAYTSEYEVPARVIRLTQTFGPGVEYRDGRVFAEFARCVIEGRDIVLHTKGETKRSYLYTEDAAEAILTVLTSGRNGEAYNAANERTYCSIKEMAELAAGLDPARNVQVRIVEEDSEKYGYAPVLRMNLDAEKLRSLGWRPTLELNEMFVRLIRSMQGVRNDDTNEKLCP